MEPPNNVLKGSPFLLRPAWNVGDFPFLYRVGWGTKSHTEAVMGDLLGLAVNLRVRYNYS